MSNKKETQNEEPLIFDFTDDEGNTEKFEILGFTEYDGRDFAVLLPVDVEEEDCLVHIFEVIEELDSEYDTYVGIDDQELVDKVYEKFMDENKDEFNFVD